MSSVHVRNSVREIKHGLADEILLFGTEKPDLGVGLSFWKTREEAERYHREIFPKVAGSVGHLMDGAPTVRSFNVEAAATFHISAGKAA